MPIDPSGVVRRGQPAMDEAAHRFISTLEAPWTTRCSNFRHSPADPANPGPRCSSCWRSCAHSHFIAELQNQLLFNNNQRWPGSRSHLNGRRDLESQTVHLVCRQGMDSVLARIVHTLSSRDAESARLARRPKRFRPGLYEDRLSGSEPEANAAARARSKS